jgi:hypothetical protein
MSDTLTISYNNKFINNIFCTKFLGNERFKLKYGERGRGHNAPRKPRPSAYGNIVTAHWIHSGGPTLH